MSKNIEYVQSEVVGSEIVETATDSSKLGDLITEAWAQQYARTTGLKVVPQPAVQVETEVVELKALLLALLRAVWKTPTRLFGGSTLGAAVTSFFGWDRTRLLGDTTYGIPAYPNASVEEAKTVLRRRDMSSGVLFGDTHLPDGMSLVNFLCGYRSQVTELKDDNNGWKLTAVLNIKSTFSNCVKLELGCSTVQVPFDYNGGRCLTGNVEYHMTHLTKLLPETSNVGYGQGLFDGASITHDIYCPVLEEIPGTGSRFCLIHTFNGTHTTPYAVYLPKLKRCGTNTGLFASYNGGSSTGVWKLVVGKIETNNFQPHFTPPGYGTYTNTPNLIHFELGDGVAVNLNFSRWSPTIALMSDPTAEGYVDLREDTSLTNNLQQFLANFRKFIILRLADRSASSALTLTLSSAVYNAVTGANSAPASTLTLADLGITSDDLTAKETAAGITTATIYATWLDTYRTAIKWNIAN